MHVEAWEDRKLPATSCPKSLRLEKGVLSHLLSKAPGLEEQARSWLGWTRLLTSVEGGIWVCRSAFESDSIFCVLSAVFAWNKKSTNRTAGVVLPSCHCSYSYGQGPAVRPQGSELCWPLFAVLWRAIAPVMAPWCSEGRCANLSEP